MWCIFRLRPRGNPPYTPSRGLGASPERTVEVLDSRNTNGCAAKKAVLGCYTRLRESPRPGKEVSRVEDKKRKKVTVWEAAEYLDLTPGKVQDMVERGVLKADRFAGAVHIPREEVERIERETAP
jgi:excisionase family DNA binding protein